jgi:twitching motility protein PilT
MKKVTVDAALADWIRTALAACDIFSGLSPELLSNLQARAELWALEPGEVLATENSRAEHFYLVVEGQLDVVVGGVAVAQVGSGMTAGEMGILLDEPRSATLSARVATSVVAFSARDTANLIEKLPGFGASIARALAKRLKNANQRIPMPLYEGDASHPDPAALSLLPFTFVRRHRVLPLKMEGNRLLLGCVADPTPELLQNVQSHIPSFELVPMRISGAALDAALSASSAALPVAALPSATPTHQAHIPSGPVPPLVPLLRRMIAEGASDLHLTAKQPPWWRTSGDLKIIPETDVLGPRTVLDMLLPVMDERARTTFEADNDVDFAYPVEGLARFRVNMFKDDSGIGAVLRQIPSKILTFEQLGLPPAIARMCDQPRGLVLVTGPTGSGKSTTLAAMIDYINRHRQAHILTMEDPVEFVHQSQKSLVNQREVGTHTKSFARALKAALREDPDIVLVGELRDRETVHLALETANTGHLVFATLHTNTAASTIDRIVDLFPAEMHGAVRSGLAESLRGVICQTLCKRIGGGRIAALEVLVSTPAINHLIRDGRTFQIPGTMQTGKAVGMQLLNEELAQLVRNKKVDAEEALGRSVDKDDLAKRIGRPVQHSGAHSL